jgi:hypothetical protein
VACVGEWVSRDVRRAPPRGFRVVTRFDARPWTRTSDRQPATYSRPLRCFGRGTALCGSVAGLAGLNRTQNSPLALPIRLPRSRSVRCAATRMWPHEP